MKRDLDIPTLQQKLVNDGYAVIENVMTPDELARARTRVAEWMERERAQGYPMPADEPHEDDGEIEAFYRKHYTVSDGEARRMVARVHQYRRDNADTRWPVPIHKVSKNFLHLPTLFDQDQSQRVWNLVCKAPDLAGLIEHPVLLPIVRHVLGTTVCCTTSSPPALARKRAGARGTWTLRSAKCRSRCPSFR